jgi:hypothetical protein
MSLVTAAGYHRFAKMVPSFTFNRVSARTLWTVSLWGGQT